MTGWVEEILRRFGQSVTLCRDGQETKARAFLQPLAERDELAPEMMSAVGALDGRLWLYLGRAELRAGDGVAWNGQRFRVRSGRPHYTGDALSHWRAVLEREKEDAV